MDSLLLARELAAYLGPFLPALVEGGERPVDDDWRVARALWAALAPAMQATPTLAEAARKVAHTPGDRRATHAFRFHLQDLFRRDAALAARIESGMDAARDLRITEQNLRRLRQPEGGAPPVVDEPVVAPPPPARRPRVWPLVIAALAFPALFLFLSWLGQRPPPTPTPAARVTQIVVASQTIRPMTEAPASQTVTMTALPTYTQTATPPPSLTYTSTATGKTAGTPTPTASRAVTNPPTMPSTSAPTRTLTPTLTLLPSSTVTLTPTKTPTAMEMPTRTPTSPPVSTPTPTVSGRRMYISQAANVRSGPSETDSIRIVLQPGTELQVYESSAGYCRVASGSLDIEGWVYCDYLSVTPPAPSTATAIWQPSATPSSGMSRVVVISGELGALQRSGNFVWSAIGIECFDSQGRKLSQIMLSAQRASYTLPQGTAHIGLWIGNALGGAGWWVQWDCPQVSAQPTTITLSIRSKGGPNAPTNTPSFHL